jgi:hypothetical protein
MEKIDEISMVFPCDVDRIPLFLNTLSRYILCGIPPKIEVIVVTRTFSELVIPGLDIRVIKYEHNGNYFCPSLALNLGVKNAKYKNIIISFPEVRPITNILNTFCIMERGNYICKIFDLAQCGCKYQTLVQNGFRDETPGLYFLAMYKREDIESINGWDMRFMNGYSNEDIDFGQRMVNAKISFKVMDGMVAEHQWHKRRSEDCDGYKMNRLIYEENKRLCVTKCTNGLSEI